MLLDAEQWSSIDAANNGESDLTFGTWEGIVVLKLCRHGKYCLLKYCLCDNNIINTTNTAKIVKKEKKRTIVTK